MGSIHDINYSTAVPDAITSTTWDSYKLYAFNFTYFYDSKQRFIFLFFIFLNFFRFHLRVYFPRGAIYSPSPVSPVYAHAVMR